MATYKVLKPFAHTVDGAGVTYTKVGAEVELDTDAADAAGDAVQLVEQDPEEPVEQGPDLGEWLAAEKAHNATVAERAATEQAASPETARGSKPRNG